MKRILRICERLVELGAMKTVRAVCRSEGATVPEVLDTCCRVPRVSRARHRVWFVVGDTLGLGDLELSRLFEVERKSIWMGRRKRQGAREHDLREG